VTVNVAGASTLVITTPTTPPTAGLPAAVTFAVTLPTTNASPIRSLSVNWGDGSSQELGGVTGNAVVNHVYRSPGSYTITATLTDSFGTVVTVSTGIVVNATVLPITITAPTTPPNEGLPATFTIAIGTLPAGDAIRSVVVDWGDGDTQDLGAISGSTTVQHVYKTAGSYRVTAVLNDIAGNTATVSSSVTVVGTPSPTIVITPSVPTTSTPTVHVTFQIQVTPPTGVTITSAKIDFGDGQSQTLGGLTGTVTVSHDYAPDQKGSKVVKVTVTDSLGRTTEGSTIITVP
jgi:PKD repeat protein